MCIPAAIPIFNLLVDLSNGNGFSRRMDNRLDMIFAALADPTRRQILTMLLEDDMAVTDVAEPFSISLAAISKHLGILTRTGLISQEKRGRVKWCKLEPDAMKNASVWMQGFGQFEPVNLDAFERFLEIELQGDDMKSASIVLNAQNIVGESIIWDDRDGRLFWVDIIAKRIHAFDPTTQAHQCWDTPTIATSIGLAAAGGFVVGLEKSVARWAPGQPFEEFATVEPDKADNRLNEGVVGPDGALWVGTMQNNINPDGSPREITASTGALHRVMADGKVRQISDAGFGITNTLIWANDGRLITADTLENALYSYARDPETGDLSDRQTILQGYERGLPDGSTMDAEGFVWNCRVVGGSCLARIAPDGRVDRVVELSCSWPTSCTFGGPDLDRLYVTSARFTMDNDHLAANPQEGGVFSVDVGVCGLPPHRFG